MRINLKQVFILLIFLIIIFPPVNSEGGFYYGSKDQVINNKSFVGFKFVYFVLTEDYVSNRRYEILTINYPFLILELIFLVGTFMFFYLGKTKKNKSEYKEKEIIKSKINLYAQINNLFQKIFSYVKEQNKRSLFWSIVAIVTIAIYILEFFTGVSKLFLSLF